MKTINSGSALRKMFNEEMKSLNAAVNFVIAAAQLDEKTVTHVAEGVSDSQLQLLTEKANEAMVFNAAVNHAKRIARALNITPDTKIDRATLKAIRKAIQGCFDFRTDDWRPCVAKKINPKTAEKWGFAENSYIFKKLDWIDALSRVAEKLSDEAHVANLNPIEVMPWASRGSQMPVGEVWPAEKYFTEIERIEAEKRGETEA